MGIAEQSPKKPLSLSPGQLLGYAQFCFSQAQFYSRDGQRKTALAYLLTGRKYKAAARRKAIKS